MITTASGEAGHVRGEKMALIAHIIQMGIMQKLCLCRP